MKSLVFVTSIVLFVPIVVYANSFKIERVWVSGDYGYALVTYKNDTKTTYDVVTIQCTAFDSGGNKININKRSFFNFEYGPIRPGFEGTLKVPVQLHGAKMKSMSCDCWER